MDNKCIKCKSIMSSLEFVNIHNFKKPYKTCYTCRKIIGKSYSYNSICEAKRKTCEHKKRLSSCILCKEKYQHMTNIPLWNKGKLIFLKTTFSS